MGGDGIHAWEPQRTAGLEGQPLGRATRLVDRRGTETTITKSDHNRYAALGKEHLVKHYWVENLARYSGMKAQGAKDWGDGIESYYNLENFTTRPFLEDVLPKLHPLPTMPSVLEIGAGPGLVACFLARIGSQFRHPLEWEIRRFGRYACECRKNPQKGHKRRACCAGFGPQKELAFWSKIFRPEVNRRGQGNATGDAGKK